MTHPATRLSVLPAALAVWAFRGVVVATLGIGLCWTLVYAWHEVERWAPKTPWWSTAGSAALAIATFAAATWAARRRTPWPPVAFVIATLVAGVALRIAYLQWVDPVWAGDFLNYWEGAITLANAPTYEVAGIYDQRALWYVPLVEAFGPSPGFLKASNVLLLALAQLAGYDTLRRLHSHQAAQAFTLAWLGVFEATASAAIPSHDLSGTALIAIAFWLNVVGTRRAPDGRRQVLRFILVAVALSVVLVLLELLRGLGGLLCLVLAGGALIGLLVARVRGDDAPAFRAAMLAVLAQAGIALALVSAGMGLFARQGLLAENDSATLLRVTTPQLNAMSEGTYAWMRGFHDTFNRGLVEDPERFRDARTALALSDFIERPAAFAANTVERQERLYALGSQYRHYVRGWMAGHKDATRWLANYSVHYAALFAGFFLVALAGLLTRLAPAHAYFPLMLACGLSLAFVTVLENQPRYLYPIWYVGCLCIGLHLAIRGEGAWRPGRVARSVGAVLFQAAAFVAVVLGAAWALASLSYTADDGRILSDWALDSDQALPDRDERRFFARLRERSSDVVPTRKDGHFPAVFGPLGVQLEFPQAPRRGDSVVATTRACITDADGRAFSFQYYTPARTAGDDPAYSLELHRDGERLWAANPAAAEAPEAVRLPLPADADGCMALAFRLVANAAGGGEAARRASRTEIFFPRIEPAGRQ